MFYIICLVLAVLIAGAYEGRQRYNRVLGTQMEGEWTPNKALAEIRGCLPSECQWVWGCYSFGIKEMSKQEAFRAAHDMNNYL